MIPSWGLQWVPQRREVTAGTGAHRASGWGGGPLREDPGCLAPGGVREQIAKSGLRGRGHGDTERDTGAYSPWNPSLSGRSSFAFAGLGCSRAAQSPLRGPAPAVGTRRMPCRPGPSLGLAGVPTPHCPLSWSSGAKGPTGWGQGSWLRGEVEPSVSCPETEAGAPALRSSRASFSASLRKGGRRAGSASQQLLMRTCTGPGQPSGGSMRYPFSTASDTSFSDCGQQAWAGVRAAASGPARNPVPPWGPRSPF